MIKSSLLSCTSLNNTKSWEIELSGFNFDCFFRPDYGAVSDTLTSSFCSAIASLGSLKELQNLYRACFILWVAKIYHTLLMWSLSPVVVQTMPNVNQFYELPTGNLIKASALFKKVNIDFKVPLPSAPQNKYLLAIADEYFRFSFCYNYPDS